MGERNNDKPVQRDFIMKFFFSPHSFATALLLGMGGVMIISSLPLWHHLYGSSLWLGMLQEGARAGVVGGLADWFAVTALFRRPMGLPIPHTAILPYRKQQLAQALGRFVTGHFFGDHDVVQVLARFNMTQSAVQTVRKPENFVAIIKILRGVLLGLFERLGDGRDGAALMRIVPVLLQGEEATVLMTRGMRAMVEGAVHQEVFSFFLAQMKELVITREPELRQFVEERVREQGGRFVGWAIGGSVASQVLVALKMELERIDPMDSALRQGFTDWIRGRIDQLENDPEQMKSIMSGIAAFFCHDSLREWGAGFWQRLCEIAERDSQREDGWSSQAFETLLYYIADMLENQKIWGEKINHTLTKVVLRLMPGIRQEIVQLVLRVVERWDGVQFAERLEEGVGRDLAYIRVNGTLVGFLVGAGLEVVLALLRG